jgi:hypothetical protein
VSNLPDEKRWKPGQSGNPKGRPPKSITQVLAEIGDGTSIDGVLEIRDKEGKITRIVIDAESRKTRKGRIRTLKYMVGARLYQLALSGDLGAIKEINNRLDGAVKIQDETGVMNDNAAQLAAAFAAAMVSATGAGVIPQSADGVAAEPEET